MVDMADSLTAWALPVVRVRSTDGGRDRYDDPIPGVDERVDLPPALFAPVPSSQQLEGGVDSTITEPTLYWRRQWPDVRVGDRLEVDGGVWLVHERPARWPKGLQVTVKAPERVEAP